MNYERTLTIIRKETTMFEELYKQVSPIFFVLDDREENLRAAEEAFSKLGTVFTAKSYLEGVRVLEATNPDIAFIDLNFPMEEGGTPQRLGERFRDEEIRGKLNNVIITEIGGFSHGDDFVEAVEYFVQVSYWSPGREAYSPEPVIKSYGRGGIRKTSQKAWEQAYDCLPNVILSFLKALRFYKNKMSF